MLQTLYDRVALRELGRADVPLGVVLSSAFAAQALTNCVGVGPLSGGALRFRFYGALGVKLADIARVVLLTTTAVSTGAALLTGTSLVWDSKALAGAILMPPVLVRVMGVTLLATTAGLIGAALVYRRTFRLWRWSIEIPRARLLLLLTAVSVVDWLLAGACAYVLLNLAADVLSTLSNPRLVHKR